MDEEISAMALRIAEGVRVDKETLPVDLIKELGPKGDYLTAPHTLEWLRSDEYLKPRVTVRGPRAHPGKPKAAKTPTSSPKNAYNAWKRRASAARSTPNAQPCWRRCWQSSLNLSESGTILPSR